MSLSSASGGILCSIQLRCSLSEGNLVWGGGGARMPGTLIDE